ncbi:MAG: acyl-ACP--UDP-N-acetylglucosamine O-acyltransferase, partial [Deltaproteobacteria bacterium]|nr:acyl-ACP--UDP-N-acetylglucosamine O-acyltransferase [Deltaproteobacteria bacterium]
MIHPSAVIHPETKVAHDVKIGHYVVIGKGVEIGEGTHIKAHSVLEGPRLIIGKYNEIGPTANLKSHITLGDYNKIHPFVSLGGEPQDLKFKGEDSTLEIGSHNTFREGVTVNRGTAHGGGVTKIGDHNLIMAYVHVAHDCVLGDHVVLANNVALAGHVTIEDHSILGGVVGIAQFCRIGKFSYMGGFTGTSKDIPPFMIAAGSPHDIKLKGVNSIGLKRYGINDETIRYLKEAFKTLFLSDLTFQAALSKVKQEM